MAAIADDPLVDAHIAGQQRLRETSAAGVAAAWTGLPNHDEGSVPAFLAEVVPLVRAAQRAAVTLTRAFLARRVGGPPVTVNPDDVLALLRNGTPPAEVYRRPFVTVWTDLKDGRPFEDAVHAGLERATSTAQMDVQLAMRQTLVEVAKVDQRILGYRRVPDAGACEFCRLVAGQRYRTDQLMPVHNRCGCSVDVITAENRHLFTGKAENDLNVTRDGVTAAVREHGELGPLLVDGSQHFTSL